MIKSIGLVFAVVGIFWAGFASADSEDRRIRVNNHTSKRIVEMYAAPVDYDVMSDGNMIHSAEDWIPSGSSRIADIDDNTGYCRYNLRVVLADGRVAEKYNVNVCVLVNWDIYD